jgi:PAS domain S-box-containing protein
MLNCLKELHHTERDTEVTQLWRHKAFFNASQRLAHFGYCEWDCEENKTISCTPAYAEIFGMSVEEVIESQNSWLKVIEQIHPEDRDKYRESYQLYLGTGLHEAEYRVRRKDGEFRHVKEVGIIIRHEHGGPSESVGLLQDITESVSMRRESEESEAKLRLAARTARLGYWQFDEVAMEYLDISEEYAQIYGYTVPEFLERFRSLDDDMELVHSDDKVALYKEYETIDAQIDCYYRVRHKDGHWVHVREISVDIKDEAGNLIESIGTLQDISELKEAQINAERANQAKNEFLSRMSHELRTPLNAVLGFAQLIEYDQSLDMQQRSKATAIFNAGRHLLSLINDVLDLSRLEAGNVEVSIELIPLEGVIRDSISLVTEMAEGRGVTIDCNLENYRGLMVEADTTRLQQVFLNLLSNAVKYNREGGQVRINNSQDKPGLISVSITDTGPGIAPDQIGGLFEPFNRLGAERSKIEGTGIGLVITKQLVELMRGEFRVDSKLGEGSTFTVQLKGIQANFTDMDTPDIELDPADLQLSDPKLSRPRILVAEDNLVNQELIAEQLDHLGYCADYAITGVEALALWGSKNYPLLLTDIRMPEMDGYELIRQIRALESNTSRSPIIAVTASTMESDIEKCFNSGADDVTSKPLVLDAMKRMLDKWMPRDISDGAGSEATAQAWENASVEAIDLSVLRRSVGNKIEVHRRLLKSYTDALPKAIYDIREAYVGHNLEQLGARAHKLKSSSSSLGATRIAQLCTMLELACDESRESEVETSLSHLHQAAESVTAFVEVFDQQITD